MGKPFKRAAWPAAALFLCLLFAGIAAGADQYTRDAVLKNGDAYPGVYYVTAHPGDGSAGAATIGIPSIAKQNLENGPTGESPAIIMGGAVPYEKRVGPMEFEKVAGGSHYPPYTYFKCQFMEEPNQDGQPGTHLKASGFDGSYVIVRVDVSELIAGAPEGSYLHVKQEGNKALMATLLHEEMKPETGYATFSDALGNKAGVYSIADGGVSMMDKEGNDQGTPYIDVVIYSSGTHVAGADTGSSEPGAANADFTLKFYVDQTADYNPDLKYDPNAPSPTDPNAPTMDQQMLAKYFSADAAGVTSYTVKGGDLELEIQADTGGRKQYWSLRKALEYEAYNGVPISLICEVSVLEGLLVEGQPGAGRHVIFDVHSFDIQIANHQSTSAAGLTVRNATLELTDSFKTTGAELAVGNNATMVIDEGGTLIIDDKCQLEVEYDAASTAPDSGTAAPDYGVGVLTVRNGGRIENRGIITVEGTEGKPIDPAAPAVRDAKDAEFRLEPGALLENYGCLLSYGRFYNQGTLINYGEYGDVITSQDPDKGTFTYHSGIQISWKDDVTQNTTYMGAFYNGGDELGASNVSARLENYGDIVLVPGFMENYAAVENAGNIYLCAVKEAVIPITPTPDKPTVLEKRVAFGAPIRSSWVNHEEGTLTNTGSILAASVQIVSNGRTGALTRLSDGDELFAGLYLNNFGTALNSGSMTLDAVRVFGALENTGSGAIAPRALLTVGPDGEPGTITDTAKKKLTTVLNGALAASGGVNVWTYAPCEAFSVTPAAQDSFGEKTVRWTVRAETAEPSAGVRYQLEIYEGNRTEPLSAQIIPANTDVSVTSPTLPAGKQKNVVYRLYLTESAEESMTQLASVLVTAPLVIVPPAPIADLVYDGTDQVLTTSGFMAAPAESQAGEEGEGSGTASGPVPCTMEYRLGEEGEWSETIPTAKHAGVYSVYYRRQGQTEPAADPVSVTIARRPAVISADDVGSAKGAALKPLTWTVSGLADGDALADGDVTVTAAANPDAVGEYPIEVSVTGEYPDYTFTLRGGMYTVTETEFTVTAKDKHGVYSDDVAYKGFNIELTAPEGAVVRYSTTTELTAGNYESAGVETLVNLPAGAGVHTVYYYVTDQEKTNAVRGSKQVIIDKAKQDPPQNLETQPETWRNSGDGRIANLTPRQMEYRDAYNDGTYETAYYGVVYVEPGRYLVRKAADENHYAGADTPVTVGEGPFITVTFVGPGDEVLSEVSELAYGDLLPEPKKPDLPGFEFIGWFAAGNPYDFGALVQRSMVLTAGWARAEAAFTLPKDTVTIGANAFAGIAAVSVEIPYGCRSIGAGAFRGCANLRQIAIPSSVTSIDPTAFDGCADLVVCGADGSAAHTFCQENTSLTFVVCPE